MTTSYCISILLLINLIMVTVSQIICYTEAGCNYHGLCSYDTPSHYCRCYDSFKGDYCNETCALNCYEGVCRTVGSAGNYKEYCDCPEGTISSDVTGQDCLIDNCQSISCNAAGKGDVCKTKRTGIEGKFQYEDFCLCPGGYGGADCSTEYEWISASSGRCFARSNDLLTFSHARESCTAAGGTIMEPSTSNDFAAFESYTSVFPGANNFHVGVHKPNKYNSTSWQWLSGGTFTPLGAHWWKDGQDIYYTDDPYEPWCLQLVWDSLFSVWRYDDTSCELEPAWTICERSCTTTTSTTSTTSTTTTTTTTSTTPATTTTSSTTAESTTTTLPIPCSNSLIPCDILLNGKCVKGYPGSGLNYDEAELLCQSVGGHLISIHTEDEFLSVQAYAASQNVTFYIGLGDSDNNDIFTWTDGTPLDYSKWFPGQPNSGNDCVDIRPNRNYQWSDTNCNTNKAPLCFVVPCPTTTSTTTSTTSTTTTTTPATTSTTTTPTSTTTTSSTTTPVTTSSTTIPTTTSTSTTATTTSSSTTPTTTTTSSSTTTPTTTITPSTATTSTTPATTTTSSTTAESTTTSLSNLCSNSSAMCDFHLSGKCVKGYPGSSMTYYDAEIHCQSVGGHLISIHSEDEFLTVQVYAASLNERLYIGLGDAATEGTFTWTDGTPSDYINWDGGQPNNNIGEDCVDIRPSNYKWGDTNCNDERPPLCFVDPCFTTTSTTTSTTTTTSSTTSSTTTLTTTSSTTTPTTTSTTTAPTTTIISTTTTPATTSSTTMPTTTSTSTESNTTTTTSSTTTPTTTSTSTTPTTATTTSSTTMPITTNTGTTSTATTITPTTTSTITAPPSTSTSTTSPSTTATLSTLSPTTPTITSTSTTITTPIFATSSTTTTSTTTSTITSTGTTSNSATTASTLTTTTYSTTLTETITAQITTTSSDGTAPTTTSIDPTSTTTTSTTTSTITNTDSTSTLATTGTTLSKTTDSTSSTTAITTLISTTTTDGALLTTSNIDKTSTTVTASSTPTSAVISTIHTTTTDTNTPTTTTKYATPTTESISSTSTTISTTKPSITLTSSTTATATSPTSIFTTKTTNITPITTTISTKLTTVPTINKPTTTFSDTTPSTTSTSTTPTTTSTSVTETTTLTTSTTTTSVTPFTTSTGTQTTTASSSTTPTTTTTRTTISQKDVCDPSPCFNYATCIPMGVTNTSHVCICIPGYTGKDCSTDIDECASTPCKHKGTCTDELNSFSCNCTKGYFGETCEDDIDECASMPCMNNGTCLNQIGKYECDCPLHYTGSRCETDLCNPNPCQHGGLCDYSNSTNDYNCTCIEIYGGKSCEKKVDNCLSDPCANGGVCVPGVAWKCQCKSGWEGTTCAENIDECASNPCNNLGNCTDHFNSFTCACLPAFSGLLCEEHLTTCVIQTDEEKSQRIAMVTAQSLSSMSLIICLCIVLVIFIFLLQFSTERILHMGEEISLLLAHLIILFARTPTIADAGAFCDSQASGNPVKLGEDQCRLVATILHYLFMVHFGFFFLEALNNYCVNTYVANGTSMYGRWKNLLLGLGVPLIPVAATAILHFKTYISDHTCWCNMDEPNFIGEIIPTLLFCVPALVMNEAAGMGHYNEHPDSVKEKRHSAYGSSRSAMVVIPLSLAAWIVGMTAVHETDLSLYSLCSILNLILGIAIVIAHTLSNSRARNLLHKVFCWWSCEKKKVDPAPPTPVSSLPAANPPLPATNPSPIKTKPPSINNSAAVQNDSGLTKENDDIDLDKMIRDSIAPISGSNNAVRRNPKKIIEPNEDIDLDKMIRDSVSRI